MAGSLELKAPLPQRFWAKWSGMIEAHFSLCLASRPPTSSTFSAVMSQLPTSSTPSTPSMAAARLIISSLEGWSL